MKYAAYCITRNLYHDVIPSLKSLLIHTDVDEVFLVIEDDKRRRSDLFPAERPELKQPIYLHGHDARSASVRVGR